MINHAPGTPSIVVAATRELRAGGKDVVAIAVTVRDLGPEPSTFQIFWPST